MKKRVLLSSVLLILCLIQAVAGSYYYKIRLFNADGSLGNWSSYIEVRYDDSSKTWLNGPKSFLEGKTVKDEDQHEYTLPDKDPSKIWGMVFANEKGRNKGTYENILEDINEYNAWTEIRGHIKYLELREYVRENTEYTGEGYFMNMHKLEKLELPKSGMNVGGGETHCKWYFSNADNLKEITIYDDNAGKPVDITAESVKDKPLLNRVGPYMFSNCYSLPTKYINRLIKHATEIRNNAFYADNDNRGKFTDGTDNNIPIEISSSTTKIGNEAFLNRVKATGLNISSNNLEIGEKAFKACDNLANISVPANAELRIGKEAFAICKQLHTFGNLTTANIKFLGTGVFGDCRSMTNEFVNGVLASYARNGGTKIPAYLFYGCNGQDKHDGNTPGKNRCTFTDLDIPAGFTEIGDGAFASSNDAKVKLKTITVNANVAPRCLNNSGDTYTGMTSTITNKRVFESVEPNTTTVVFASDAADGYAADGKSGYKTYQKESEFKRLLTKTLDENKTTYDVYPQMHAIVELKRTFKKGWNTLALPFGSPSSDTKDTDCAEIYQKALSPDKSNDFMIAAYRGLKNGTVFTFLKYANVETDPLDEFEPILVKMSEADAKRGTYTFTNVDLNYDHNIQKLYKPEELPGCVDSNRNKFNGYYDIGKPFFKGNDYSTFYFDGTFCLKKSDTASNFITSGDYIIQGGKFIECTADNKYALKGFRGWFKRFTQPQLSKGNVITIELCDNDGTVTEIVNIDNNGNATIPYNIYNVYGQKVRSNTQSTEGLARGIYIVNGKKVMVN